LFLNKLSQPNSNQLVLLLLKDVQHPNQFEDLSMRHQHANNNSAEKKNKSFKK